MNVELDEVVVTYISDDALELAAGAQLGPGTTAATGQPFCSLTMAPFA